MELTQKLLKEYLKYNPTTGEFVWLVDIGKKKMKGKVAGTCNKYGYHVIRINGECYQAHRLAFLYMTSEIPEVCDHKNRIGNDNRWCNLRPATYLENSRNAKKRKDNTSGYTGVSYLKDRGKYIAKIRIPGNRLHLGTFTCKHHAFCEYVLASRKYFGEFSAV